MTAVRTRTTAAPGIPARSRSEWLLLGGTVACAILWLHSLTRVRLEDMGAWGLVSALPVTWYVSFAGIVALYAAALLSRRPIRHTLAGCHLVLILILAGTTSAVYDAPRFHYTYKHVAVVEYLLDNGWSVDTTIDIYHNFPGFFYVAALVHEVTRIPLEDLAQWAPPAVSAIDASLVYWVVGALTASRRTRYAAAFLFTMGDWIGQNYFAPQAAAFAVSLLVLGGMLRTVPPGSAGIRRWAAHRAGSTLPEAAEASAFWRSRWGGAALVAAFGFVAVSHQLSPMILIAQCVVICLLLRPARPWLPALFVVMEAVWIAQAWDFLGINFRLLDFGVENASPPTLDTSTALPGHKEALWAAPLLIMVMALFTASALLHAAFRAWLGRLLVLALIAVTPAALIIGQPYGNEAVLRIYLFALPWAAAISALVFFSSSSRADDHGSRNGPERRPWAIRLWAALTIAAMTVLMPPASYALELINRIEPSDVAAATWFEEETAPGSVIVPLGDTFPLRPTGQYYVHVPKESYLQRSLAGTPGFDVAARSVTGLMTLTREACRERAAYPEVYIAVGASTRDYFRLYGTVSQDDYAGYVAALRAAPDFETAFEDGPSMLFRCAA